MNKTKDRLTEDRLTDAISEEKLKKRITDIRIKNGFVQVFLPYADDDTWKSAGTVTELVKTDSSNFLDGYNDINGLIKELKEDLDESWDSQMEAFQLSEENGNLFINTRVTENIVVDTLVTEQTELKDKVSNIYRDSSAILSDISDNRLYAYQINGSWNVTREYYDDIMNRDNLRKSARYGVVISLIINIQLFFINPVAYSLISILIFVLTIKFGDTRFNKKRATQHLWNSDR